MTRPTQIALGLLGAALSIVTAHYARNVDSSAAAPVLSTRLESSGDHRLRTVRTGHRIDGDNMPDDAVSAPSVRPPGAGPGGASASEVATADKADDAPAAPATILGVLIPRWLEPLLRREPSAAAGGGTVTPEPATPTAAATATASSMARGCNHALETETQGVSARLEFVGVLLDGQQVTAEQFSGATLSDLKIVVQWQSLFQNHMQRLDLIAPDGSLYQSLSRPLTATDASVETLLPVNGTWITRYGLYGGWCVEVFLDQQNAPITSSPLVIARSS